MDRLLRWWQQDWQGKGRTDHDPVFVAMLRASRATQRAKRRGGWGKVYQTANSLFHLHPADFVALLRLIAKWTLRGIIIGLLCGTASAIFLTALAWATQIRLEQPWLLWWLPVAGLFVGWIYYRFGGAAAQGNNLVIDEVNRSRATIPLRMAPLVLLGTVITHLFGGSAGREGTAIQMGASLADSVHRLLGFSPADRRMTLMAGISGGFGSVFGVPVAGAIFGMEVQSVGRIHYEGLIPCFVAAYVGDLVTRAWGVPHAHYPQLANVAIDPWLLLQVSAAGIVFGLTSLWFVELTHGIKRLMALPAMWAPLYPLIGGILIIGLTQFAGTDDYLGLSLPLIEQSLDGSGVVAYAFLLKLLFTAITLGTGYLGGEVTPLFVIGSTLGYTLGTFLGVDPTWLAAIGLVAVFAGASNTPLACAIMGVELFGGGGALYFFLACVVAYLVSGHRGIYGTQVVGVPKVPHLEVLENENLHALIARRQNGWLPSLERFNGMLLQKPVSTVMTRTVVTAPDNVSAAQLVEMALAGGVRSVPVTDNRQQVVGLVTDRDLARSGINMTLSLLRQMTPQERLDVMAVLEREPVQTIMTQPVITIHAKDNMQRASEIFARHKLKRLPVVDDQGRLVGMITRSDLLRELAFASSSNLTRQLHSHQTLQDIPLQPAVTVATTSSLADAIQAMRAAGQTRVVATDRDNSVVGILTLTDLMTHVPDSERLILLALLAGRATTSDLDADQLELSQSVADVMTAPVITVGVERTPGEALQILLEQRIKRLPVVDSRGKLLGLVGRAAILWGLSISSSSPQSTLEPFHDD